MGCTLVKDQVIYLCACVEVGEKIMVDQRRSRRILKQVKQCVMPIYAYCALIRPAGIFKCSHAYRHVQWDVH